MLKNAKIRTKFVAIVAPMVILIIGLVISAVYMTSFVSSKLERTLYDELYKASSNLINADRDYYQALVANINADAGRDSLDENAMAKLRAEYDENYNQAKDRVSEALEIVKDNPDLNGGMTFGKLVEASGDTSSPYAGSTDSFSGLANKYFMLIDKWYSAYDPFTGEGSSESQKSSFDYTRNCLNEMEDYLDMYAKYELDSLDAGVKKMVAAMIAVVAVIIIATTIVLIVVVGYILKGVKATNENLTHLASKDLSFTPYWYVSRDEIGQMCASSNKLYENLKDIMTLIGTTSEEINVVTDRLNTSSQDVETATREITTAINEIAENISEQAHETGNASEQTKVLEGIVDTSAKAAENLAEVSSAISTTTDEGMQILDKLFHDTEENSIAFDNIFESIDEMATSASKIAEASSLISNIADQTNLLSLNASIEAARAGEAGRGFAVVAEEIRQLANQSADAVNTIDNMLEGLNACVEKAVEQREVVKNAVSEQEASVGMTGEKYQDIVVKIEDINSEIKTLEELSENMDASCKQVVISVNHLSDAAATCAANSEETSASTTYVQESMSTVTEISANLVELTDKLQAIMDDFTL